ncbi:MAG: hypothetical protein WDA59_04005 [Methanofastidiosum sp.]
MINYETILMEATQEVEKELNLENAGWIQLGQGSEIISSAERINNLKKARVYYMNDPMARQIINIYTNYTFGNGVTFQTDEDIINELIENNRTIFTARGGRLCSDKLLVDGEVFFALFLGDKTHIRTIDPLEITEIITDVDDKENVLYYKREWVNQSGQQRVSIYRSVANIKGVPAKDAYGNSVRHNEDAIVYHLANNTLGQRGNSILTPVLTWINYYRRFMASRIAVTLALARFAWRDKVAGGSTAVEAEKGRFDEYPQAGAVRIENLGSTLEPIKTDTGAQNAYQDGRMIRLQVSAGVGIPEQYLTGDIGIGNYATSKTVELPLLKQFQSYQQVWQDAYIDLFNIVFEHEGTPMDRRVVDVDFPEIAPTDSQALLQAIVSLITVMPEFADSNDIKQLALSNLGIDDPNAALDAMQKESKGNPNIQLAKALREFRETIK